MSVSYTHLRAHETDSYLVCRLLLEKKKAGSIRLLAHPSYDIDIDIPISREREIGTEGDRKERDEGRNIGREQQRGKDTQRQRQHRERKRLYFNHVSTRRTDQIDHNLHVDPNLPF